MSENIGNVAKGYQPVQSNLNPNLAEKTIAKSGRCQQLWKKHKKIWVAVITVFGLLILGGSIALGIILTNKNEKVVDIPIKNTTFIWKSQNASYLINYLPDQGSYKLVELDDNLVEDEETINTFRFRRLKSRHEFRRILQAQSYNQTEENSVYKIITQSYRDQLTYILLYNYQKSINSNCFKSSDQNNTDFINEISGEQQSVETIGRNFTSLVYSLDDGSKIKVWKFNDAIKKFEIKFQESVQTFFVQEEFVEIEQYYDVELTVQSQITCHFYDQSTDVLSPQLLKGLNITRESLLKQNQMANINQAVVLNQTNSEIQNSTASSDIALNSSASDSHRRGLMKICGNWCGPGYGGINDQKCKSTCQNPFLTEKCLDCQPNTDDVDLGCVFHDFCFYRSRNYDTHEREMTSIESLGLDEELGPCSCNLRLIQSILDSKLSGDCGKLGPVIITAFLALPCGCAFQISTKIPKISLQCRWFLKCSIKFYWDQVQIRWNLPFPASTCVSLPFSISNKIDD